MNHGTALNHLTFSFLSRQKEKQDLNKKVEENSVHCCHHFCRYLCPNLCQNISTLKNILYTREKPFDLKKNVGKAYFGIMSLMIVAKKKS